MNEETTNTSAEETADAFLQGWDGSTPDIGSEATEPDESSAETEKSESEAQPEGTEDVPANAESGGSGSAEVKDVTTPAADAVGEKTEPVQEDIPEQPKTWTLRHLDDIKTVNEQEITALAQKGLDYDRIREKYDAAKPVMELFSQSAKQANMTLDEYVSYIRTEAKKAAGMDDSEAKRSIELEDREAAVSAKEAEDAERKAAEDQAKQAADTAEERRKADIAEFQKTFPDAAKDPKSIPQSVWDKVKGGERLAVAFALYQVEQAKQEANSAKQEAAAKVQNAKNEVRSSGSMKSAGDDSKSKDPFLAGWD